MVSEKTHSMSIQSNGFDMLLKLVVDDAVVFEIDAAGWVVGGATDETDVSLLSR